MAFSKPRHAFLSPEPTDQNQNPEARRENPAIAGGLEANYLAHDAHNWLTALQVYCDLLRTPGVVSQQGERWINELARAIPRGRGLVDSLLESSIAAHGIEGNAGTPESSPAGEKAFLERRSSFRDPRNTERRWSVTRDDESELGITPAITGMQPGSARGIEGGSLDIATALLRRRTLLEQLAGGAIHVEIDASQNAGNVALTEGEFDRILQNLVGNAIDAMPNGGRLRVSLRRGSRGRKSGQSLRTPAGKNSPVPPSPGGVRGGYDRLSLGEFAQHPAPTTPARNSPQRLGTSATRNGDRRSAQGNRRSGRLPVATAGQPTDTLLLRIHDSGNGIAPEFLAGIFDPGASTKTPRNPGHAPRGFGLAIVRELTKRAGGVVRVRSQPGKGTCFEIELPRI